MSAAGSISGRERIVTSRRAGRYARWSCGQAGQLVRGPHAPPAAATFRMGTARHGARDMDIGQPSQELHPQEALVAFCANPHFELEVLAHAAKRSFSSLAPAASASDLDSRVKQAGFAAAFVESRLSPVRLKVLLDKLQAGELIARGVPAGDAFAEPRDLPAHIWEAGQILYRPQHYSGLSDEAVVNGQKIANLRIRRAALSAEATWRKAYPDLSAPLPQSGPRVWTSERSRAIALLEGWLEAQIIASPGRPTVRRKEIADKAVELNLLAADGAAIRKRLIEKHEAWAWKRPGSQGDERPHRRRGSLNRGD